MKKLILSILFLFSFVVAHNVAATEQTVEIAGGLNYLQASQNLDGSWGDARTSSNILPTTVEVFKVLGLQEETGLVWQNANSWLSVQNLTTTEQLASRIIALSAPGGDLDHLLFVVDEIRLAWGGAVGYDVNNLDTALVLQALNSVGSSDQTTIGYAISYLLSTQNDDGGWGLDQGLESNIYITAQVVMTFQKYKTVFVIDGPIDNAVQYLQAHRQADGGFGEVASEIPETALSYLALYRADVDGAVLGDIVQYLKSKQAADGSWGQDVFKTALALRALTLSTLPKPAKISGTVMDDDGTGLPIGGVTVELSGQIVDWTATASDGVFLFADLPAGTYSLSFSFSGYQLRTISVNLLVGQNLDLGRIMLHENPEPLTGIQGTVSDADTNQPIAGALIAVSGSSSATVMTGASGNYSIAGLSPGGITISVSADDYDSITGTGSIIKDRMLTFSPNLSRGEIPPESNTAGISGVVVDSSTNQPIDGVTLEAVFGEITKSVTTANDGLYSINGLPTTFGSLYVNHADYNPVTYTHLTLAENTITDMGQIRLRQKTAIVELPDLVISSIDMTNVVNDPQTLSLEGSIDAVIANSGTGSASSYIEAVAFYDVNKNSLYEEGKDIFLGLTDATFELAVDADQVVTIPVSGRLPYLDAPVKIWVDSSMNLQEGNEDNNVATSAGTCRLEPLPVGTLNPVLKWHWSGSSGFSSYNQLMSAPAVAQLNDDNDDGAINCKDIPDVIFSAFRRNRGFETGVLRAISGLDGTEIWHPFVGRYCGALYSPAVGDIDNDGLVEIVVGGTGRKGLKVYENDGNLKWSIGVNGGSSPALSDIDNDGNVEIIYGSRVYNADGSLIWGYSGGSFASVVDLDLDGMQEIISSATAYDTDGSILWSFGQSIFANGIGNFDEDDYPEIVLVTMNQSVVLLEHTGEVKWGPVPTPGGGGGPVTISDVDGDGEPEIGLAGRRRYVVFETDGSVKWTSAVRDYSSYRTGSSVFDFEGDGKAEILYSDERNFRIYDGETGKTLWQIPNPSRTGNEYPLVVDVDNDGHAEIVLTADNDFFSGVNGIRVFENADDNWMPTRQIWNQHTYHINNVNDDGTIPRYEQPSWLTHNTYRLNAFADRSPLDVADLTASRLQLRNNGDDLSFDISVRIGNGGTLAVEDGVSVSIYEGDSATGVLLGTKLIDGLGIDSFVDVTLSDVTGITGTKEIYAVVDSGEEVEECNEDNNSTSVPAPTATRGQIETSADNTEYGPDTDAEFIGTVTNTSILPGEFVAKFSIEDAFGTIVATFNPVDTGLLTSGAEISFPQTWNTENFLTGAYIFRAVLETLDGVVADESTTNFTIIPMDNGEEQNITLRTVTDKSIYSPTDTVLIQNLIQNLTVNNLLKEIVLRTSIFGPDGVMVFTQDAFPGQLVPGAQYEQILPYSFARAKTGLYTVLGEVLQETTNDVLVSDQAQYEVLEDLKSMLDANAQVQFPELSGGQQQIGMTSITNQGSHDLDDLMIRQFLSPLGSAEIIDPRISTIDLSVGESRPLTETFASGLQAGEYEYIVQASLDDAWETIAYAPFIAINTAPEIESISAQPVPVRINETVSVSGIFSDIDIMDIHTATFDWGDGNTSEGEIIETDGSKTAVGNHVYDTSGIYTVTLTVIDDGGLSDQADYPYLIVYDPNSGTVTGGGWIDSPPGAYSADPTITGKANFGFVCKYHNDADTPEGQTEFNFKDADFNFHAGSCDWLVITGSEAIFMGSGTVNGDGDYKFIVTCIDGQANGGKGADSFQIKIWDQAEEEILYENLMQDIKGSITIHK